MDRQALQVALVELRRGERAAADAVFRLAWPVVHAFARRWLDGSPAADDIAQQALIRVFEQAPSFRPDGDALSWILELTVWECRTERARLRRARVEPLAPRHDGVASAAEAPHAELERAELQRILLDLALALRPEDRAQIEALLAGDAAGDARSRKRRQRAVERLKELWRRLHDD